MKIETFKLYEDRDYVQVTAYIVEASVKITDNQPRPAVIINPGGGYLYLSKREAEPIALRFAAMGYHAFVLEYSTYSKGGPMPDLNQGISAQSETAFPAPMVEIAKTFELIHQHAERWLVDTEKIGLVGFSAGGHNAATYGTIWNHEIITSQVNVPVEQLKPAFLILAYPLIETDMQADDPFAEAVKLAVFADRNPDPDEVQLFSPVKNVGSHTPPSFIWATSEDELVPAYHSLAFANALAREGIPVEVHIYEQGPHGLATADPATANINQHINDPVATWMIHVQRWLDDRFALELGDKRTDRSISNR